MLFIYIPPYSEHISPINFISSTWVVVVWADYASTLRKSNRNFIMVSPLSGPANPDFRGGSHPASIQKEPFSLITLALLLLPSSHCYSISAQGYWFSFCGVNLGPDQAELGPLTLTLIHIKAIWTANSSAPDFASSLHQREHYSLRRILR